MDYQQVFLDHLDLVEQVVRFIARRHHLSATDQDEFLGTVRHKLVDDKFSILRKFKGHSSLRTYLTSVIQHLFLDYRIKQWGKWRPSAVARRLGPTAVLLERLVTRDGMRPDEAIETLRTNYQVQQSADDLRDLLVALPNRAPRRWVGEEALVELAAHTSSEGAGTTDEQVTRGARIERALIAALATLSPQDALILKLRFEDSLQVSSIARSLKLAQKPLYRKLEHVMAVLRAALESHGVTRDDIVSLLESPEVAVGPVLSSRVGGNSTLGPSMSLTARPLGPSPGTGGRDA